MIAGDLHLDEVETASREALVAAWREFFNADPPRRISQRLMRLMIASEIQWKASGISRVALMRRLEQLATEVPDTRKSRIKPGTRLVREWHGRKHVVDVTAGGFEWQGETWLSLSAIAREITGTRWSGPRFFGVRA